MWTLSFARLGYHLRVGDLEDPRRLRLLGDLLGGQGRVRARHRGRDRGLLVASLARPQARPAPAAKRPARQPRPGTRAHTPTREEDDGMNDRNSHDLAGGIFGVAAVVLGVLAIFFVPFAFAPAGLICLIVAILCSPKYKGLYQ